MESASPDRPRMRARKACLACNARRVRCNVLEKQPCQNCVAWDLSCEIRASRRGKYPRRKKRAGKSADIPPNRSEAGLMQQGPLHDGCSQQVPPSCRPPTEDTIHKTVFLGESSPLTCVVDEGRRSPDKGYAHSLQKARLHYSIAGLRDAVESSRDTLGHSKRLAQDRLIREGALNFPPPVTCDILLRAYFEWFHPCFPIVNRAAIQISYREGTISPLLLQAVLFIGVSLCSDAALNLAGFHDRYQAKSVFYRRAKEIYDVAWEPDTTVKLQSLFLLSFWRGGPTEERDVRFWLGAAISLAQKKGLHVMSKLSFLSATDQKIWKRIWWALYVRDQQTSAALGLPPRIRDEDCEVAELQASDFEENEGPSEIFRQPPVAHASYVIGMAQLAKLLREVVSSQYLPARSTLDNPSRPILQQRLRDWESNLPQEMLFQRSMSREVMFLVGMLHMTYHNLYILLYRPLFIQPPSESTSRDGNMALDAAVKSTRILEDMLSENLVQHGSLHLITHTFSALCINTIHFGRMTGTARKLAEHRAKLCLLGLKELQKSWDLKNWVLDLFFRSLDDCTARNLQIADSATPSSPLARHAVNESQNPEPTSLTVPRHTASKPLPPSSGSGAPPTTFMDSALNLAENTGPNMDWYELFSMEGDDVPGLAGSLSNPDHLNPQNLEFLYRFL